MLNKKKRVVATFATLAAITLVLTQTAGTNDNHGANKLEGTWISTVPGTPVLASLVMSPADPSGRQAAVSGKLAVRIPVNKTLFPDVESSGDFSGEAVMTGPDTANFTLVGYGTKTVLPTAQYPFEEQLVLIWVDSGQLRFTTPGKAEVIHQIAYYLPGADVDGDGIPDGAPVYCIAAPGLSTRVGLMPPCTPSTGP